MQPPIPAGTILQGRYALIKVLGQGGFGRTYLAQDQGRFNESCVVKEFIPQEGDPYVLEKSKELFQREAAVLYQIQHPQIPQFRTSFEQGRRLFFVQDYVQGQTYGALLEERLAHGTTFSEAEIVYLLQQMLPVLAFIHGKGIIHRDISPDNIILRESDQLPVLIDFGVVKEALNQMQAATTSTGTTVGKAGYAPGEQLQTGKAYPSSDLYALAVTAIVLVTGRNPQDMLDETTLTWHWQHLVPMMSPGLVQLLNRMISPKAANRYPSANEVAQVLRSLTGLISAPSSLYSQSSAPTLIPPEAAATVVQPSATQPQPASPQPVRPRPVSPRPAPAPRRLWLGWTITIAALALVGIAPWIVINSMLQSRSTRPSPSVPLASSPSPTATTSATTTPDAATAPVTSPTPATASPSPSPIVELESLTVAAGKPSQVTGQIGPGRVKRYLVTTQASQTISVNVLKGTVTINPQTVTSEPLKGTASGTSWQSQPLAQAGNYQIDVSASQETNFTLEVNVKDAAQLIIPPSPIAPTSPSPGVTPNPTSGEAPNPAASPAVPAPVPVQPNSNGAVPAPATPSPSPTPSLLLQPAPASPSP